MKRNGLLVSFLSLILMGVAQTAHAVEWGSKEWRLHGYWKVYGGASISSSLTSNVSAILPLPAGYTWLPDDPSIGGTFGLAVGVSPYRFIRVDIGDVSWRSYEVETLVGPVGNVVLAESRIGAFTYFTNVYFVPLPDLWIRPYLGAGIGGAFGTGSLAGTPAEGSALAWNARGGVELSIIDGVSLVPEYRYLSTTDKWLAAHELTLAVQWNIY